MELIKNKNGVLFTNSFVFSKEFKKKHKLVMKEIKALKNKAYFKNNFKKITCEGKKGYSITNTGLAYLSINYTGRKNQRIYYKFLLAFQSLNK